jgi:hypothetical protein
MKRSNFFFSGEFVFSGALLLSVAACTPAAPVESAAQSEAKRVAIAAAGDAIVMELPDPAPAAGSPRPGIVMMTARLGDPVNDLALIRRYISPPDGFAKDLLENPRSVIRTLFGALGGQIKLDKPVDIVAFSPEAQMPAVLSFQLHDFPRTRKQLSSDFTFTKTKDGGLEVAPIPGAAHTGVMAKANVTCSVYSSAITDVYHLVCSEGVDGRALAGPYLAHTASRAPVRPGIRLDVHESFVGMVAEREGARIEREASSGSAYDKGQRLGSRLVKHAFEDMNGMAADFSADSGGVHAAFEIGFKSARSPLTVGILGSGASGVATPKEFFRIPSDADMAFYFPGATKAAMRGAAAPFWVELASADLSGMAGDLWRQFIPKLTKTFLTGGPCLFAHGPAPAGTPAPIANDNREQYRLMRIATAGWTLVGAFEPVDTWTASVRTLMQNPTIFTKRSATSISSVTDDPKIKTIDSTEEVPVVAADGLPSGSMHIVSSHAPNPLYRAAEGPRLDGPYAQHFFIGGSKGMTWIVISDNEKLAREKLAEVLKDSSPGLSSRRDLAPLRSMPAAGIGFANVHSMASFDDNRDTLRGLTLDQRVESMVTSDSAGTEPIFFSLVTKEGSGGQALRIQAHGNDDIMRALVSWIQLRPKG